MPVGFPIANVEEMNGACKQLIIDHHKWVASFSADPDPLPCIFGDILARLPDNVDLFSGDFSAKRRRVMTGSGLGRKQYCPGP